MALKAVSGGTGRVRDGVRTAGGAATPPAPPPAGGGGSPPPVTGPDPFTFTDVSNAALSTVYTSNTITLSGLSGAAPISITGGTYSVNGGAYTSSPGTVNNGDSVSVRVTSSGSNSAAVNAVLNVNGVTDTYSVTTQAAASDTTPDAFSFTDVTGATLATVYTSNAIVVSGINAPSPISITGGTYSINGGAFTSASGTVNSGDSVAVRVTSSASNSTAVNATLTIGGVSDTYSVTTQAAAAPATTKFSMTNLGTGTFVSSNGDLTESITGGNVLLRSIAPIPAGSYYFEAHMDEVHDYVAVGITNDGAVSSSIGFNTTSCAYYDHGIVFRDSGQQANPPTYATGALIGVKVVNNGNATGTISFTTDGSTYSTPVAIDLVLANGPIYAALGDFPNVFPVTATFNFGATAYGYGLPSGFSSIPG